MRLGTETGSVINHLMSRSVIGEPTPDVGMGATILMWSDRHAGTITMIKGDIIEVTEDDYKPISGSILNGDVKWEFTYNPNGRTSYFRKSKTGLWENVVFNKETGRWKKSNGQGLIIGRREKYYDPHF
jgi:hypothetical protein